MPLRKVKIESGWVEGVGAPIPTTTIYKSIPFAAPPVGENRWRAPQPVEPWEGVYQAFTFKAVPPYSRLEPGSAPYEEFHGFGATEPMSEDCLYLSIWTPAQSPEEKLPVLLHFHGGGFIGGYSYATTFMGDEYAKQGIVFVTAEYRQGYLGYLAHPELTQEAPYHSSGNYGLLDQVAALKWVRRNIAAFGGDPDKITINGQSAGAISCEYLMYSPLSRDDVDKVILQSGGAYTNKKKMMFFAIGRRDNLSDGEVLGKQILQGLGVHSIDEARQLPWETILKFQIEHPELYPWPIIDGYFIPRDQDDVIREGDFREIPVIIGATREEGLLLAEQDTENITEEEIRAYEANVRATFGRYAQPYLEYNGFFQNPRQAMNPLYEWEAFNAGAAAWCEQSANRASNCPPYYYIFTHDVPGKNGGPSHSMDLWYSFHTLQNSNRPMGPEDYRLADVMCTYFCNFIKTGDPNGAALPVWRPYTASCRQAMEFGEHIGMIPNHLTPRMQILTNYILDESDTEK